MKVEHVLNEVTRWEAEGRFNTSQGARRAAVFYFDKVA